MKKILLAGLWLFFFCLPAWAYQVEWYAIITASGEARGGDWGVVSSLGGPICGESAGGGYSSEGGYITGIGILPQTTTLTLTATAISSAMVRLTWNDLTNEEYYSLKRDNLVLASRLSKDTTSYEDTSQLNAETEYQYLLTAYDATDNKLASATTTVTTLASKHRFIPYHNLFHPAKEEKVSIYYKIDGSTHVSIKLYNLAGELVKTLTNENKGVGQYWVDWDGKNDDGTLCAAGVYIIQIKTDSFKESKKIILIK